MSMSSELHANSPTLRHARATPSPPLLEHWLRVGREHSAALGYSITSLNAALQVAGPGFQLRADPLPLPSQNVALEQAPPVSACFAFYAFTSSRALCGLLPAPMRPSFDASGTTSAEQVADGRARLTRAIETWTLAMLACVRRVARNGDRPHEAASNLMSTHPFVCRRASA